MKQSQSLLLRRTLFTSLLPLIIAGFSYALTFGLKIILSNHESLPLSLNLNRIESLLKQIGTLSLSVYDDYFHFMVVMGVLNLIWKILTSPMSQEDSSSSKRRSHFQGFTAKFVSFSVIYLLFQIMIFTSPSSDFFKVSNLFHSSRVLEQEDEGKVMSSTSHITPMAPEKLSLSIGKIKGSLRFDLDSFVLSKNGNYIFALARRSWILKVIDVSDLEDPLIKTSLEFDINIWRLGQTNLILSPDGNTLYISDFKNLQIVNVTNPLSPKALGFYEEKSLPDLPLFDKTAPGRPLVTLALSKDNKTLFIGGFGLQIFDVSTLPKPPKLIFKILHNCGHNKCMNITSLALSADERHLFVANGTLDIHQISSAGKLSALITSYESPSFLATSIFLLDDKTVFLAGTYNESKVALEKVDISNLQAPKRLNFASFPEETPKPPFIVASSPKKTQLYVLFESKKYDYGKSPNVVVYDITKDSLINDDQSLLPNAYSISISADGRKVFASLNAKFLILGLFLDYPNKHVMSLSRDLVGYFKTESFWAKTISSLDNQILFVNPQNLQGKESWFEIWNVTKRSSPSLIASERQLAPIDIMTVTADYTKAFLYSTDRKLTVLDIRDLTNPATYASFTFDEPITVRNLKVSKDGHYAFAHIRTGLKANFSLVILDFSEPNSINQVSSTRALEVQGNARSTLLLDKYEKTAFIVHQFIEIYDVSDPLKPTFLNSLPGVISESDPFFYSASLSPDSKTLFVEFYEADYFRKLCIFNVSDPTRVNLISETPLPMYFWSSYMVPFQMTPDMKTGYVFQGASMLILDLTDLAAPSIAGIVPLKNTSYSGWATDFSLSFDGKTAFSYNTDQEMSVLDLELKNTLYINQEIFPLGKKYSDQVKILQRNNIGIFTPIDENSLKFLTVSLYDIIIAPNLDQAESKVTALPSWLRFDTVNRVLTIDAKRQVDLNNYTLCTLSSRNIPEDAFFVLDFVKNQTVLNDLVNVLISLGYVDNALFLTSQVATRRNFRLNNEFTPYIDEIYGFLEKFLIKTATTFEIVPSVNLLDSDEKFLIQTPSLDNIRVEITLHPDQKYQELEGQFLFKPYASLIPVITERKSKLRIEGPLNEVNQALGEIVVNYENDAWCNGEITVNDHMNPLVSRRIGNISRYFWRNEPPKLNSGVLLSAQEQMMISPIYTGQYFTIDLNKTTFRDEYTEELNYNLMMAKEPHELPDWLIFQDLVIKGTPPEEILGRDVELVLQVKNEFKTLEVPLRLHIRISSVFFLKLIMRYAPYVLTLLGLLISANKVYNVLAQKYYKHRKEFLIECGEEVTPQVIYPVLFFGGEKRESKLLLKEMFKEVKRGDKAELLSYFMTEERQLDKEKIIQAVKKVSLRMDKKKLRLYRQVARSMLINKIIINELTKWQIASKQERETREIFEKLKKKWIDIVDWSARASGGFIINPEKWTKVLEEEVGFSSSEDILEKGLLNKTSSNINVILLKDAIEAYAFEDHHIDAKPIEVKIVIKEKVEENSLLSLFKLDLKDAHLHGKNKLDYGIDYKIKGDTLFFFGIADENLEGKTLVVQIKNLRKRILKEIWTHGVSRNYKNLDENNASYEVY